ncbi:MAG TPA: inositol monophosphatase family protein [Candidatus Acidoferrales bacterium]|nr:inositol monophosphatase family protein [Candidatus Acidoferrales bacterium]
MSYKSVAIKAAKEAGKTLKFRFDANLEVKAKSKHDIVSNVDVESERKIIQIIKKNFPTHAIQAEESGAQGKISNYRWIVDPLDGTANFVTGNPFFSVSIALTFQGKVILGVVYNPILNQLYYAEKGKGAFLNGNRIVVSKNSSLKDSFIVTGNLYDEKGISKALPTVKKLILSSRKTLIIFSPALNLCNLARGKIDGFVDRGATPEDHAAGSLIATEAGARVQNYYSDTWDVNKEGIVASNGKLHNAILKLID